MPESQVADQNKDVEQEVCDDYWCDTARALENLSYDQSTYDTVHESSPSLVKVKDSSEERARRKGAALSPSKFVEAA